MDSTESIPIDSGQDHGLNSPPANSMHQETHLDAESRSESSHNGDEEEVPETALSPKPNPLSEEYNALSSGVQGWNDEFNMALESDLDSDDVLERKVDEKYDGPRAETNKIEYIRRIRSIRDKSKKPVVDRAKYIIELEAHVLQQLHLVAILREERDSLKRQIGDAVDKSGKAEGQRDEGDDADDESNEPRPGKEESKLIHSCRVVRLAWTKWTTAFTPRRKRWNVIEVLVEAPRSVTEVFVPLLLRRHVQKFLTEPTPPAPQTKGDIERVRINSPALVQVFQSMLGEAAAPENHSVFLKPFKLLICYEEALQGILTDLRKELESQGQLPRPQNGDVGPADQTPDGTPTSEKAEPVSDAAKAQEAASETDKQEKSSDKDAGADEDSDADDAASEAGSEPEPEVKLTASPQMVEHLEFLLEFIGTDLKSYLNIYRRLRAREVKKIAFKDLWYLFAPGDKVYDASAKQACQVLGVRGGRPFLSKSPRDEGYGEESHKTVSGLDEANPFIIECFYLGFDGEELGPVNHSVKILPYDGERAIQNLKVYPLEYAKVKVDTDDGPVEAPMERHLIERGEKFVAFMDKQEVAHREYSGLSVGNVREQIDSRVIIDISLYFERHPKSKPSLGLVRPPDLDTREITERNTCRCISCGSRNSHIYDDGLVDRQRTDVFISGNAKHWRLIQDAKGKLTSDQLSLLPAKAYGYVLRSRRWCELDVDKIMPVDQKPDNFQDLVLPPVYKQLVEGMVRTHSRGVKPSSSGKENSMQAQGSDLVRGKGKGVIILLHGVPGVGKTSTAECVAEYTFRPLFSITCGDIGENAQQVEQNLEENFQLAHHWGCVMLLDEADVFLQTRNKQDMQRNAIVSVFLRILEYYSGILFLTTNKVGTFDEAFKSRIHLSLYYPPLNDEQTNAIWEVNLARLKRNHPSLDIEDRSIMTWVKTLIRERERDYFRPWNGRQIHNACQTAASIALFQDNGKLTLEHFEIVSKASMAFDKYLRDVHGADDSGRAKRAQDRDDQFWNDQLDYGYGLGRAERGEYAFSGLRQDEARYDGGLGGGRSRYDRGGDQDRYFAGGSRYPGPEASGYFGSPSSRWRPGQEPQGPRWPSGMDAEQSGRMPPPEPRDARWGGIGPDSSDPRHAVGSDPRNMGLVAGADPERLIRGLSKRPTFEG